jgi:simple sugar transport system substrate-binding protein
MKQGRDVFDPFVGPIYDQDGNKTVADGELASIGHLFAEMMYQVDNFISPLPQ